MVKKSILFLLISALLIQGCYDKKYKSENASVFVSDFEGKVRQLSSAQNLELWKQASTGKSDSLEDINDRLADFYKNPELHEKTVAYRKIVSDDVLKRKLDLMYRQILRSRIKYHSEINYLIDSLNNKLAELYSVLPLDAKNSAMTYFLCEHNEVNMSRKNKKIMKEIGNGMARLVRLRNLAAKRMGYNSYYSMNAFIEYSYAAYSDKILNQLEEQTRSKYQGILNQSGDVSPNDIEALCDLLRQQADLKNEYSYYFSFSEDSRFKILINTFKSVGFDLNKLPVFFNNADSSIVSDIARVFAINCRNDIRVVLNSTGGMESFYSLFHATGFAIYASHIKQDGYLFRDDPTSLRTKIILSIVENIILTEKWLNEYLDLPEDFAFRWRQDANKFKILELRSRLLMARFEEQLYLNNAWRVKDTFQELFNRIMDRPANNAVVWWAALDDYINRPFYIQRKLIADLAAAQILNCLIDDESGFESSLFKYTLVQNCFAPGQHYDWYDMLVQITGEELNAAYYLNRPDSTVESDF